MVQLMAILNLTPDSFWAPSRASEDALARIDGFVAAGASIIDLGAVSTRPGASPVSARTEWRRLSPVLRELAKDGRSQSATTRLGSGGDRESHRFQISIDTTRASIVRKAFKLIGPFIVNDISAGEDDPEMLPTVAELGLPYIAMHKRGNPQTMNGLCDYPDGVMPELLRYFGDFARRASALGIRDWILDPGLGFAKTSAQCWEILERLEDLQVFGRPILIGAADKRFTRDIPPHILEWYLAEGRRIDVARSCFDKIINEDCQKAVTEDCNRKNLDNSCLNEATDGNCAKFLTENCQNNVDGTAIANALAVAHGASILRVHQLP